MRFSRERSCSVEIPGSTRCSSTNRRGPETRSRTMSSVHLSPTRSSARASGDHWSYGCRFGEGTAGMSVASCLAVRVRLDRPASLPEQGKSAGIFERQLAQVLGTTRVCKNVGTVISLADRRRSRARSGVRARRATFYFDLADPGTYLAAERIERLAVPVAWQPATLPGAALMAVATATRRAREL